MGLLNFISFWILVMLASWNREAKPFVVNIYFKDEELILSRELHMNFCTKSILMCVLGAIVTNCFGEILLA